jgi:hypothetical protein
LRHTTEEKQPKEGGQMTDHEKAVVMAYTGVTMLKGDKFQVFHKYVEDLLGRPVFTHELADDKTSAEIKKKSRNDFLKLCEEGKKAEKGIYLAIEEGALAEVMAEKRRIITELLVKVDDLAHALAVTECQLEEARKRLERYEGGTK